MITKTQQAILDEMDRMQEPKILRVHDGYLLMDGPERKRPIDPRTVHSMTRLDLLQDVDNGEFVRPGDTWWR